MRSLILVLLYAVITCNLQAQFSASGSFLIGVPQGEFATNVGRNGYGVELTGAFAPREMPIRLGLNVGILSYGADERREPFSTTIPDVTVLVSTTNNIYLINGEARLQPNKGLFRPYLTLTLGASVFDTRTTITNTSTGGEVASSSNQGDVVFNYGAGGGLNVRVWSRGDEEAESSDFRVNSVAIHLGATYLKGGEAEYLKKGSIRTENGKAVFDVLRSKTDIILYSIGVSATF